MFGNGNGAWKEEGVERSEERKSLDDEIGVGENGKKIVWGSARVAEASRMF